MSRRGKQANSGITPTCRRALKAYEDYAKRRGLSPKTKSDSLRQARLLFRETEKALSRITRADVERHLARRRLVVARTTLAVEAARIVRLFRVLVELGFLKVSPVQGLKVQRPLGRVPRLLGNGHVQALLAASDALESKHTGSPQALALRNRAIVEVLFGAGVRVSELCGLGVADVDLKRGEHDHLGVVLACERRRDGHDRVDVGRLVRRLVRRAGPEAGRAHPHAFRRAVATGLVREGASLPAVQELLGHCSLRMTQEYVQVDWEDLVRAVEGVELAPPKGLLAAQG